MQLLDTIRQQLMDIVRTPYADMLAKADDILKYIMGQPAESRGALMSDVLCWWNMVPFDRARTNTEHLPFTRRNRAETAEAVDALIGSRELSPDDPFEQNLPLDQVGTRVLAQLEKAGTHSHLHQLSLLLGILSSGYVPYVGHVTVANPDPVTVEQMTATALANLAELSALEAIYQHPHTHSTLSAWALGLPERTDPATARILTAYAISRFIMLTRQAMQMSMGGGGMPMMIRLGGPPDEGDGPPDPGNGGIDPKKAN